MLAVIAFIPIIVTVIVMAGFNWPAKIALPLAWLITAVIGFAIWQMDLVTAAVLHLRRADRAHRRRADTGQPLSSP